MAVVLLDVGLREDKHGQQMQPLASDKLKRVDVNGVIISAAGCLLLVVMLVHKAVNCAPVQQVVESRVEEVVDDK